MQMVFVLDFRPGQFVAGAAQFSNGLSQKKMAPETGAMDRNTTEDCFGAVCGRWRQKLPNKASETEIGEIAVADGDAAARGQKAVDGGHQAAEQGAGRKEADGCSLGHECPLSEVAEQLRVAIKGSLCIPDTTQQ